MSKTKPITKQPRTQGKTAQPRDPRQSLSSIYSFPSFLEQIEEGGKEDNYNIYDFLSNLQADHYPYYDMEDDNEDPPTAPIRMRPSIDFTNKQYLEKMGELLVTFPERKVGFSGQIKVKFYCTEESAACVLQYQEHEERVKDGSQMEEQGEE